MLDEIGEGVGQGDDFEVRVDGLVGEQLLLEGLAAGIGVFLEAFAVGLGAFVTGAEEVAGQTVGIGIEGDEAVEEALTRGNLGDGLLRVRDAGKRGEGVLAVGAIGEVFLESGLGGDFGAEEFRIMQCGDGTVPGFAGILDTEEFIFGAAGVLGVAVAPVREEDFAALQERELVGKLVIADVFKFWNRE